MLIRQIVTILPNRELYETMISFFRIMTLCWFSCAENVSNCLYSYVIYVNYTDKFIILRCCCFYHFTFRMFAALLSCTKS